MPPKDRNVENMIIFVPSVTKGLVFKGH